MKIVFALILTMMVVVTSGLSGMLFVVWPTSLQDRPIDVTPQRRNELQKLLEERKFAEDLSIPYPGAMNEHDRLAAQLAVDSLLRTLLVELPRAPRRAVLLLAFKRTLTSFDTTESEERDRLLAYLNQIMGILGVESSGELLNVWRYGLPYGWMFHGEH